MKDSCPARELADTLDDSVNLAMMDWEDFEHLIRELFEQEFSSSVAAKLRSRRLVGMAEWMQ